MTKPNCNSCRRPQGEMNCELCQELVCKKCILFLEESTFSFLSEIPENLKHTYYCPTCHETQVIPQLNSYNEVMGRAKSMYFFFDSQRKPLPLIDRAKHVVKVSPCEDRDETVLRLAFKSAELGYNSVIKAQVESEKVRNSGYQKSVWTGSGLPANLNIERLNRGSFGK